MDSKQVAQLEGQGVLHESHPAYKTFTPTIAAIAVAILALFLALVDYAEPTGTPAQVAQYYHWLLDVNAMIFIGFGFLMTFLRRYGYGAVGFNFFTSALVMLEAVLLLGAVQQGLGKGAGRITLELPLLVDASFCAGSAMIAYGAVLGKTTPTQLTWLLVCLVPLYALNQHLVFKVLRALDMGGSITIHAFGAYYGLAASLALSNGRQAGGAYTSANIKNSATYTSNLFSMIGTLFLFLYWPSFNGALASLEAAAEGHAGAAAADPGLVSGAAQFYCVVNTMLSLLGSVVATFMASSFFNAGRFDMMHVQNASLAGGVAMGSSAALRLSPGGAVAVGLFAGCLSTWGFAWLSGVLEQRISLGDTCGVHNLHGMPGLLGGFIAGLAALGPQAPGVVPHGRGGTQLGIQVAALAVTACIAAAGGALAAAIITGRLGGDQLKAAAARRRAKQQLWAGAAADGEEGHGVGTAAAAAAIDGLALFDDSIFWTEVQLETPFSGGHAADLTNFSRRAGSQHGNASMRASGSQHRAAAVLGSAHGGTAGGAGGAGGGSRRGHYATGSKDAAATGFNGGDVVRAGGKADTNGGGLYAV